MILPMKKLILSIAVVLLLVACNATQKQQEQPHFMSIDGKDLIAPDGSKFFIRGTNLGNWLNPEGYMFGFSRVNSPRFINEMFCQMV